MAFAYIPQSDVTTAIGGFFNNTKEWILIGGERSRSSSGTILLHGGLQIFIMPSSTIFQAFIEQPLCMQHPQSWAFPK
jgi:hypothetical protein